MTPEIAAAVAKALASIGNVVQAHAAGTMTDDEALTVLAQSNATAAMDAFNKAADQPKEP